MPGGGNSICKGPEMRKCLKGSRAWTMKTQGQVGCGGREQWLGPITQGWWPQERTWDCILSWSKEVTYVFKDTILADE